jgi:hypothetical protein
VTHQAGRNEIGEVTHCRQCAVNRLALQHQPRDRLVGKRLVPCGLVAIERHNVGDLIREHRRYRRIECAARPTANNTCREFVAAYHPLEGGVSRDVSDPQRQRDLVALRPTGKALAVPALGELCEQDMHRGR